MDRRNLTIHMNPNFSKNQHIFINPNFLSTIQNASGMSMKFNPLLSHGNAGQTSTHNGFQGTELALPKQTLDWQTSNPNSVHLQKSLLEQKLASEKFSYISSASGRNPSKFSWVRNEKDTTATNSIIVSSYVNCSKLSDKNAELFLSKTANNYDETQLKPQALSVPIKQLVNSHVTIGMNVANEVSANIDLSGVNKYSWSKESSVRNIANQDSATIEANPLLDTQIKKNEEVGSSVEKHFKPINNEATLTGTIFPSIKRISPKRKRILSSKKQRAKWKRGSGLQVQFLSKFKVDNRPAGETANKVRKRKLSLVKPDSKFQLDNRTDAQKAEQKVSVRFKSDDLHDVEKPKKVRVRRLRRVKPLSKFHLENRTEMKKFKNGKTLVPRVLHSKFKVDNRSVGEKTEMESRRNLTRLRPSSKFQLDHRLHKSQDAEERTKKTVLLSPVKSHPKFKLDNRRLTLKGNNGNGTWWKFDKLFPRQKSSPFTLVKRHQPSSIIVGAREKLVNIGGVLYRATSNKLTLASLAGQYEASNSATSSSRIMSSKESKKKPVIRLNGERFLVSNNGNTLRRLSGKTTDLTMIQKVYFGGVTFEKSSGDELVRTKAHLTRQILISARQRSLARLTSRMRKNNVPCIVYRRVGRCNRFNDGVCPFTHDRKNVDLCKKFLKGECLSNCCLLSHDVGNHKMPTCKYYLAGACGRDNCPYLHVKLSTTAAICPQFLQGYCPAAKQCSFRHVNICPDFEKVGFCKKGKKCHYPHVDESGSKARENRNGEAPGTRRKASKRSSIRRNRQSKPRVSAAKTDEKLARYYLGEQSEAGSIQVLPKRKRLTTLPSFIPLVKDDA